MANQSYNIKDVYKYINTIDGYFDVRDGGNVLFSDKILSTYCRYLDNSGFCRDYLEMASSGVIYVLKTLKEKCNLEYDKLAEYAILWLRYKLNQKDPYYKTQLNEFYTKHIKNNNYYNVKISGDGSPTYKDIIDTKKDLMDIKEMTNFSYPFKLLLLLYNKNNKNSGNCIHSDDAKKFANKFEELNKDSNNIEYSSYNKMLSRLSDDYNNLINKCTDFPPLPKIEPKKNYEQILGQTSEVTSSSSSISTTLIPALSIVSVIPVFLGISYKYSLFGVDKLFQRQHLRKKFKKVKKKLKLNI
ncbi:PIR protein CIR protein [Plasmodium vinckei lentum]|uniref:PIR protein CIR protein n=1 Tax=Plasmodium vinckei lentum TaxID=138297 RepID=A0A6V7S0S0_PLAVN|nr:PIR protein CIR protein [Plasmodium vinckei lentum]